MYRSTFPHRRARSSPTSHARVKGGVEQGIVGGILGSLQEPVDFILVQGHHFYTPWLGRVNGVCHIAGDEAPFDRMAQGLFDEPVMVLHSLL